MKRIVCKSAVLMLLMGCGYALHADAQVQVGEEAPDFTLTSVVGNEHSLSDFRGQYVVLEWINHGCPFVRKFYDAGEMQRLQEHYTDKGVIWLAICSSRSGQQGYYSKEEAARVSEEKGAKHTAYLYDEPGDVGRLYGARVTPHMYVINPEGVLIYQGAIDSVRSASADDIERAENYVVAALDAAMAGEPVATPVTTPYGCSVKY
jgi:alkyl hydroperoxide reductase subunit AhpC